MTHEIQMTFTEQELVILAGLVDIALKHEGARIAKDAVIIIDKFEKAHNDIGILQMQAMEAIAQKPKTKSPVVNTTSAVNEPELDLRANTGFEWSNDVKVPRTREWDVPRKRPDPTSLDDEFLVGKK